MRDRLNGIDMYYERRGAGPQLLFLAGSGASVESSAPLIDVFAASFDVLAQDQRGLGNTSVPAGPYQMSDYAADAAALLDYVGWTRCRVVGVSFGGMVAQEFAVTWPDRVERLALACTSPGGAGGSSYPLHELAALPAAEQAAIGLSILDTRFTAEWLESHPSDRGLVEAIAKRRLAPKTAEAARGAAGQLDARSRHDVCDRLHTITAPTFVACGRFDGIAPPANSEFIAARVPHAQLHEYEGGHAFFMQDKNALPEIVSFLAASDG